METKILIGVASALWLAGCSSEKIVTDALSGAPQVAQQSSTIVCEYDKLTTDVYVPLSLLAEAPHIVKLDNRDEATVEQWAPVAVSENYILALRREKPLPAKLFRKTGEYVAQVGALGNGPGQYHFLYDHQLDELAGRIYLCPWQTDHLLEYDLQGQFVRNIPLAKKYANVSFPKMKFVVDSERQRLTAFSLPFPNLPVMAWTQDLEGNIIDEIPIPQDMKMRPDFSHEVLTTHSAEGLNVFNTARGRIHLYVQGRPAVARCRHRLGRQVVLPLPAPAAAPHRRQRRPNDPDQRQHVGAYRGKELHRGPENAPGRLGYAG